MNTIPQGGKVTERAVAVRQIGQGEIAGFFTQSDVNGGDIPPSELKFPWHQIDSGAQCLNGHDDGVVVGALTFVTSIIAEAARSDRNATGRGAVVIRRKGGGIAATRTLQVAKCAAQGLQISQIESGGIFAQGDAKGGSLRGH